MKERGVRCEESCFALRMYSLKNLLNLFLSTNSTLVSMRSFMAEKGFLVLRTVECVSGGEVTEEMDLGDERRFP